MKLNSFENKRTFINRSGKATTVVRDTYINQTTNVPLKAEVKKEEPKQTSSKKTTKKTSQTDETKRILPTPTGKQSTTSGSSD